MEITGGSVVKYTGSRKKAKNIEIVRYCVGVDVLGNPVYVIHYI